MPSANLDLVRSIYSSRESGDFSSAEWAHPEIEYVLMDGPSPTTFTGLIEMASGLRDLLSPWKDVRSMVDDYRELDDERTLVLLRYDLRGKASGLELDPRWTRGAEVVHIRDGRVRKIVKYFDRDHAFADLGLAPETG